MLMLALHSISTKTIVNTESARISVPPLLSEVLDKHAQHRYKWRTDLEASQPYWHGGAHFTSATIGLVNSLILRLVRVSVFFVPSTALCEAIGSSRS